MKSLATFAIICATTGVQAQIPAYPSKPVRLLVGNAPGGGSDTLARALARRQADRSLERQGYELTNWYGLYGPAGMSGPVVLMLHRDVTRLLGDPDLQSKFDGAEPTPSASPAAIRDRLAKEVSKWEKLL